ncbi:hypothetical protein FRC03_002519 [Tulasnella sp. 419]|nr:hypothetical protein FRC02_001478 [Tulasnella sp. 418]KAG8963835.1 hypothetical protein FRC03_002519 [Tulasnella sp. 419]
MLRSTSSPTRASPPPAITIPSISQHASSSLAPSTTNLKGRARSSSIVKLEEVGEGFDELLDQSVYRNLNTEWVNRKGAWAIHIVLIAAGKFLFDTVPGITQDMSWTLVNITYMTLSYLMFHYVTGIPFEQDLHGGAYDDLTLWEQIDEGAQYTPAKKWLVCCPIGLFLASTHYTHYDPWLFAINFTFLLFVLVPKLPQAHGQRIRILPPDDASGMQTPVTPYPTSTPTGD